MKQRRLAIALWLAFAFVTWNVSFDRSVADAAHSFTREQIVRQQQGSPPIPIETGFSPHLQPAALRASLYATIVLTCAIAAIRRSRS